MSAILDHHQVRNTPMRNAIKRAAKFNLWAAIAVAALFGVLAVKAQVLPKPWITHHTAAGFAAEPPR